MKSKVYVTTNQTIVGDGNQAATIGFLWVDRETNTDRLDYRYSNGTSVTSFVATNFFQNLDNQWIHIVIVCDYTNKTGKFYRNGVQFGATWNLAGAPQFPSINRAEYIGAYADWGYKLTDGFLDEVRIYNRGLSAEEVMAIYNQTKSNYE
jgi:hypothetical protein